MNPLIYNCSDELDPTWEWIKPKIAHEKLRWRFFTSAPRNFLERHINHPSLKRIRTAWEVVKAALVEKPALIVIHGPLLAFYILLVMKLKRVRIPTTIYAFNFTTLPHGIKKKWMGVIFQTATKIVVSSTYEKKLYQEWFHLAPQQIDLLLWAISPPRTQLMRHEQERYICAIGGNGRDYRTLLEAAKALPHIPLILVVRPDSLKQLEIPAHVKVFENLSFEKTMGVLKCAEFMVLPLIDSQIPCGHVTLVASMHLSVPFIITDSEGVADYVQPGTNALVYPAGSAGHLKQAMTSLWNDQEKRKALSINGNKFATRYCSEETVLHHFLTITLTQSISKKEKKKSGWGVG